MILAEVLISVKFNRRENKLYQHFVFGKQKYTKFIIDKRFLMYRMFVEKTLEHSLGRDPECEFLEKRETDNEVVLVYETTKATLPPNYYFKVIDIIPPCTGCEFCVYKNVVDGKLICKFQNNKILPKELKNCRLFLQKRIIKL